MLQDIESEFDGKSRAALMAHMVIQISLKFVWTTEGVQKILARFIKFHQIFRTQVDLLYYIVHVSDDSI